jgi:DNA-binding SARP family transcriptional activator/tetratricopeptide (TPR) repeat protein
VEFLLLGPLTVRSHGEVLPVRRGKQRAVLAALLLHANQVVSVDELTEAVWDGARPPSAQVTLQNYVKRLRHALGDTDHSVISTQPRGYQIQAGPDDLDLSRFRALLTAAQLAARQGAWEAAAEEASSALALWRGDPLADVESELLLRRDGPRLAEMRLEAEETRIDASLHLGRHAELIGDLRQLTADYPLRERSWVLLMLALHRSGRQADALAAYQQARAVLVGELGTEPGAELRAVQRQVLAGDNAAAVAPAGHQAVPPVPAQAEAARQPGAMVVPRQLPAPVRHFTGRGPELAELTRLLRKAADQTEGPVLITAIGGTAGVGKTALAVQGAHQVAACFPDGQLYVNLRGYDLGQPMSPGEALARFLRALGVPGQQIPSGDDERAAQYRSLLAGRRILVILDNASDAEQVRPLLPGFAGCAAVVTSRDSLTGLIARDGARRLDLDLLPMADAVGLLRALIGSRVDRDGTAARSLAQSCCRLPLALRVAAELVAARSSASLADLAAELADQQQRLDRLDAGGDPETAVRAVFSWSYRHLDLAAARGFRLLGLHPGPDADLYAVAALTGAPLRQARDVLDRLVRVHVAHLDRHGRLHMHDLLRAYAAELASRHDSETQRRAALTRLLDHYLHTAAAAMNTLYPAERHRYPQIPTPATPVPPVGDPATARAWLDAELAVLVTAAALAADHGWPHHAIGLSAVLFRYLEAAGHLREGITIHDCACRAARLSGDRAAEAIALISLGGLYRRQDRYEQAAGLLRHALALSQETGDLACMTRAWTNLAFVELRLGHYEQVTEELRQAIELASRTGNRTSLAFALSVLGFAQLRLGRCQQAGDSLQQAVALRRETGDRNGEAQALTWLGLADLQLARYRDAEEHFRCALRLFRETGDRHGEGQPISGLGDLALRLGLCEQAIDHHRHALALFRGVSDRAAEAAARNTLGDDLIAAGQPGQARAEHAEALTLARQVADRWEQARAHDGLARGYLATGQPDEARRHCREALRRYAALRVPDADQVRERLAALSAGPGAPLAKG